MAIVVGGGGQHRETVLAEDFHRGARHRLARCDRVHERVLTPVGVRLDQKPEVGDQRHAPVVAADDLFRLRVPGLDLDEEQATGRKVGIEIQRCEGALPRVAGIQVHDAAGQPRQVVGIERVSKPGIANTAARLARQVVDGPGRSCWTSTLIACTPRPKNRGPVFRRLEDEPVLGLEVPLSGQRRREFDPLCDAFAYEVQPRGGKLERRLARGRAGIAAVDTQRIRYQVAVLDARDARGATSAATRKSSGRVWT